MSYISIPIDKDLYNEFILRTGKSVDVANWIENIVEDFLDRTKEDHPAWSNEYYIKIADNDEAKFIEEFGNPSTGYYWQNVLLKNGSRLRFTYKGTDYFAEIKHSEVIYNGAKYSPSEFVNEVAKPTSRNAWRDIWVKFPNETEWQFADSLRKLKPVEPAVFLRPNLLLTRGSGFLQSRR